MVSIEYPLHHESFVLFVCIASTMSAEFYRVRAVGLELLLEKWVVLQPLLSSDHPQHYFLSKYFSLS
mgnify:CR=1